MQQNYFNFLQYSVVRCSLGSSRQELFNIGRNVSLFVSARIFILNLLHLLNKYYEKNEQESYQLGFAGIHGILNVRLFWSVTMNTINMFTLFKLLLRISMGHGLRV